MLFERESRLTTPQQSRLISYFYGTSNGSHGGRLLGIQPTIAIRFFIRLRWLITSKLLSFKLAGEVEAEEGYLRGKRKAKRAPAVPNGDAAGSEAVIPSHAAGTSAPRARVASSGGKLLSV